MRSILILLLISLSISSCEENACCNAEGEATIVGSWKLSKLCFSDGSSTCTTATLWDADREETISFTAQREFTFNREGVICNGNYERVGEIDVNLVATSGECNFDETTFLITRLTDSELIFSPLCAEGCPHLYVRQ